MRATTISTAAICSLGVLAAYGVSNRVNSTPQPESSKEKPTVEPAAAPALAVTLPIAKTIAPPENLVPSPGSITQKLAKERQQREARLAEDLAQISVPALPPIAKSPNLTSINIPDVQSLPIDNVVAQSANSAALATSKAMLAAKPRPVIKTSTPAKAALPSPPPPVQPIAAQLVPVPATASLPSISPALAAPIAQTQATAPVASPAANESIAVDLAVDPTDAPTVNPAAHPAQTNAQIETTPVGITQPPPTPITEIQSSLQASAQAVAQFFQPDPPAPQATAKPTQPVAETLRLQPAASKPATPIAYAAAQPSQIATYPTAQTVTQAPAPTVTNAAAVNQAYTLGPGDQLSLRFFNAPEYNGDVQVLSDGTLNLPVVGNFSVAGMTLQQAEAEIAARYQTELRYSVVTVSLTQPRPLQVSIVGEVQQPGSYILAQEGAQFPGIVQAIKQAGGTTQSADLRSIQVRRSDRSNPNQLIAVNLVDLLQTGDLRQDLKLRDGDQIVIPTAAVVNFAEAPQVAAANFAADASQPIDVAIVGDVFRPGSYEMGGSGRSSLTEVIQQAGGVKPTANIREIQIRRSTRSGAEQIINIDLGQLIQSGNISQDLTLQQGDRITIPTATSLTPAETTLLSAANLSPETMKVNVVGEVKSPGVVQVSPGSTLNQVLLAAGGLNNRATRELEVIRLEPNGTLTRRTIKMDIKQGFNTDINPLLMNNDIVVVGRSGAAQLADQLGQINSVVGPILQLIPFSLPSF